MVFNASTREFLKSGTDECFWFVWLLSPNPSWIFDGWSLVIGCNTEYCCGCLKGALHCITPSCTPLDWAVKWCPSLQQTQTEYSPCLKWKMILNCYISYEYDFLIYMIDNWSLRKSPTILYPTRLPLTA